MSQDRKNLVLGTIIEHFIKTAQPVGSKTIILSYDLKVSPATVRNDMANLEKEGLITHPHTSAGRVPTDKGYRVYVDELADFDLAETRAKETLSINSRTRTCRQCQKTRTLGSENPQPSHPQFSLRHYPRK